MIDGLIEVWTNRCTLAVFDFIKSCFTIRFYCRYNGTLDDQGLGYSRVWGM